MIKHLKGLEINTIYDFDNSFSINELLCKFWEKIEETINISNESIDILNWIKEEGLPDEVQGLINQLVADGTIEQMINVNKIEELRTLINTRGEELRTLINTREEETNNKITNVRKQIDIIEQKLEIYVNASMQTEEIQTIIDENKKITFKNGEYHITKTLELRENSTYIFEDNVEISSSDEIGSLIKATNSSNITIKGKNTLLNLNEKVDNGINIVGAESNYITNIKIDGIIIKNRKLTKNKYVSGLTVRYCNNLSIRDLTILDYGYRNIVNNEVYGIGLHWCNDVELCNYNISDSMIGVLLQACANINIYNFNIRNTTDNGIYLLLDNKNIIIKNGFIYKSEEGIANYANDILIDNVIFDSCTNKGLTFRQGNNCTITNCIFKKNKIHVGDDNYKEYTNIILSNCNFIDSVEYSIFLRKSTNLKIDNNIFTHSGTLNELIRFADTTSNDCNNISIINNIFNLNSNVTYAIRFAPYNGGCLSPFIGFNRFNECNTAISIFKSTGANGGDNPYILKNIYSNVSYDNSISGAVTNQKIEKWL